ncbi:multiple sugar transport system substrate-binding protein [Streptosporangium becharense]|uniref:Multiple sugar transport system substrate-binding protein n=1 Tax=Streptosporangium becharense TaxID=1816182 RepID=A0A7W9ILN2_9ACTN|nr:sugar ABC transporter substrate-binding protein [Streptosporangium becharense]MBB2910280.1 multiple sugar transport system substrate-binding protein [Streptosporangium becharense]MBB5823023.1 multiple sugar transport system substrate-binding protein [Streptosporangium becharense]
MKLRIAAFSAAAVAIMTAASACGSSSGEGSGEGSGSGSGATITWNMWSGDNESTKKLEAQMAVAQQLVPDVKIELQTAPWTDYFTKLNANMASGKLACITSMNGQRLSGYTAALTPLTDEDLKVAGISRGDYNPGALSVMEHGGKLYGLPYDTATMFLYYNADLFKKAGVAEPTNTWTVDDFEAAAKTITEKTGVKGFAVSIDEFQWLSLPMAKAGLQVVTEDGKLDLTNPTFVKAAEWYSGLVTGLKVSNAVPSASETTWDPGQFETGKAAMIIDGTWNATKYTGKDMPFTGGAVRIPSGAAGPFGVALGSGYGIAANCENKQAALKVLGALAGPKVQAVIAQQGGYPAQLGSQPLYFQALAADSKEKLTAAFTSAFDGASAQRVTEKWTQVTTAFPQELVSVYAGQKTMADALGGLQQRFAQ